MIITGVRGFGAHHLANARRLEAAGRLTVVALADPVAAAEADRDGETPVYSDLDAALAAHGADIVIVATPLGTHAALAASAMLAGADVLLEKPPVPSLAFFDELLEQQEETGSAIQVGFQSLGSHALDAFAADAFGLGTITAVSAKGLWTRPLKYWSRARWAGRRVLDGHSVVDGVATNPFAHAVATALWIAGYRSADSVGQVHTELYRVNAIEADDTSVIRVESDGGIPVTCALTLCAPPATSADRGATVTVTGARGSATFSYTTDVVEAGGERYTFGRSDLLENLLEHRRTGAALITPLVQVGAFMRVVEAIRTADEPTTIDPRFVAWHGDGPESYPVIDGIEHWIDDAAARGTGFAEVGAPWAHPDDDTVLATAAVAGHPVADYQDGAGTIAFSSPHPYLHPVRTLGGVRLSARHPADHDWHVGLGFAMQDAGGVNFWGGRTYVAGQGYQRLDDHGRIVGDAPQVGDSGLTQRLRWEDRRGDAVLVEERSIGWTELDPASPEHAPGWLLAFETRLAPAGETSIELGSPGSKGREAAGYGGLFWRLPTCEEVRVFTPDAEGEDAVNGSVSPWLALTARFLAAPGECGVASIVLLPADDQTAADPWFVRVADYPGIGSAVAWDRPVTVDHDGLTRRYRAVVLDGPIEKADAARYAARARSAPPTDSARDAVAPGANA